MKIDRCYRSISSKAVLNLQSSRNREIAKFGLVPNISKTKTFPVSNSQGRNLGRSVCLLELPVCLPQNGDLGESGKGIFTCLSN